MATNTTSIARMYLVTSQEPCSATLTQGETIITWNLLTEGGQATVIVPSGADLALSSPSALLTALPETFKSAPAGNNGGSGGRGIVPPTGCSITTVEDVESRLKIAHESWFELSATTQSCTLIPSTAASVIQTHLIITPAATMPTGWLTAAGGSVVRWPFGELAMVSGWSYIITLVQIGNVITANALPVDLSTPTV